MATEKQIRANRANAKKSTGPKTAAGRAKSSRNALRHGLTLPLAADPFAAANARQIAEVLVPKAIGDIKVLAAIEMAQAHAQLLRVGVRRRQVIEKLDLEVPDLRQIRRLAALDRYERQALGQRRRASRILLAEVDSALPALCEK